MFLVTVPSFALSLTACSTLVCVRILMFLSFAYHSGVCMIMPSQSDLPSRTQGIMQGEYATSVSSVKTVISASGSAFLALDAADMPAAPDPMTMIFLAMWLTLI